MKFVIIILSLIFASAQVKKPLIPLEMTIKLDCSSGHYELLDNSEFILKQEYFKKKPQEDANSIKTDYAALCQKAFETMLSKQEYITQGVSGSLSNSFYYKMPGLFSIHDGYSKFIYVSFNDRSKNFHSEMYFIFKVQQFLDDLTEDYYIKEKSYFLMYTYSSPCFV